MWIQSGRFWGSFARSQNPLRGAFFTSFDLKATYLITSRMKEHADWLAASYSPLGWYYETSHHSPTLSIRITDLLSSRIQTSAYIGEDSRRGKKPIQSLRISQYQYSAFEQYSLRLLRGRPNPLFIEVRTFVFGGVIYPFFALFMDQNQSLKWTKIFFSTISLSYGMEPSKKWNKTPNVRNIYLFIFIMTFSQYSFLSISSINQSQYSLHLSFSGAEA